MIYKNRGNQVVLSNMPITSKYILDIGCGAGDNARELKAQNKIIDGITLSVAEKELAKVYMRDVYIHNLENGLPNDVLLKKYDMVICSHVLEHICWPEKLLKGVISVLNDNGILVVALPNLMHYKYRWKLVRGNFDYTESGVMDRTHFRWYTFKSGEKMLKQQGFNIVGAWVDGHLPVYSITKYLPHWIQILLKRILFSLSKGLFGEQLFYKAQVRK